MPTGINYRHRPNTRRYLPPPYPIQPAVGWTVVRNSATQATVTTTAPVMTTGIPVIRFWTTAGVQKDPPTSYTQSNGTTIVLTYASGNLPDEVGAFVVAQRDPNVRGRTGGWLDNGPRFHVPA